MKASDYTRASNDPNLYGVRPDHTRVATEERRASSGRNAGAEDIRDSIYGHSHSDRDNTHSGFGGHNTSNDKYGRDRTMENSTSAGTRQVRDIPLQNAQAARHPSNTHGREVNTSGITQDSRVNASGSGTAGGSGVQRTAINSETANRYMHHSGEYHVSGSGAQELSQLHRHHSQANEFDSSIPVANTGVNSGAGIHAQQYSGRDSHNSSVDANHYGHHSDDHHGGFVAEEVGHYEHVHQGTGHSGGSMQKHSCPTCGHTLDNPVNQPSSGSTTVDDTTHASRNVFSANQRSGQASSTQNAANSSAFKSDMGDREPINGASRVVDTDNVDSGFMSHMDRQPPRKSHLVDTNDLGIKPVNKNAGRAQPMGIATGLGQGAARPEGLWTKAMGVKRDVAKEPPRKLNFSNMPKEKPSISERFIDEANKVIDRVVKN